MGARRWGILLGPLLGALLPLGAPAQDAPPGPDPAPPPIRLEARAGHSPLLEPGWTAVEVWLENRGGGLTGDLVVELAGDRPRLRCGRRVELDAGVSRREWFVLPLGEGTRRLDVRLWASDGGGAPLAEAAPVEFLVVRRGPGSRARRLAVVHVLDRPDPLASLWLRAGAAGRGDDLDLRQLEPAGLPDRSLAYAGLDLLVVHDADLSGLGPARLDALDRWLRAGGRLLLVPGARSGWLEDPAIQRLAGGARPRVRRVSGLPQLERLYGPFPPLRGRRSEFVLHELEGPDAAAGEPGPSEPELVRPAERLEDGTRVELVRTIARGAGRVELLAVDPGAPPFDRWAGQERFVATVLFGGRAVEPAREAPPEDPTVRPEVIDWLAARPAPAHEVAVPLLVGYLLCVGPLNYWLLARRRGEALLAVTVPLIALVFSAAVFGAGYGLRQRSGEVLRVTVLEVELGAAEARDYTALACFSGVEVVHDVLLPPGLVGTRVFASAAEARRAPLVLRDEGRFGFPAVRLGAWEQACFEARGVHALGGGGVRIELEEGPTAARDGRPRAVVVTNGTPWALERGVVIAGGRCWPLPPLAAGGQARQAEPLAAGPVGITYGALAELLVEGERRREVCARTLRERGVRPPAGVAPGPLLLASLTAAPGPVEVSGHERPDLELALLVARGAGQR